jgi:IclR family transcriptional regulator, KDG regulon repressor
MALTSSPPTARPKNMVQAIERAAAILDVLGRAPQGVSIGEIAAQTGLAKGTAHRLLASLVHFDFVRQDSGTRRYQLGFKLVELGNRLLNQIDLRDDARPFLLALAEEVQETVHLVVRDRDEALYIDKVALHPKRSGLQMVSHIGSRTALHSSAVGKILLAALPEEDFAGIIARRGLSRRTEKTITDATELRRHLEDVRRKGYAVDDEENEKGIRCVGAPVSDAEGKVVAALSVSGPTARVTRARVSNDLQRQVREAALTISRQLGFRGEAA